MLETRLNKPSDQDTNFKINFHKDDVTSNNDRDSICATSPPSRLKESTTPKPSSIKIRKPKDKQKKSSIACYIE